ncbi:MAG: hypothetical protein HQK53_19615, partial [Oligoflexia bacterium]|nr:hypothetical protein [Oligoflexia bacterium]
HSKALHNRKTLEICLPPLSPRESGKFIKDRSSLEKAMLYMCLGGIPKYLEQINPSLSVEKNLNQLCFTPNGFFVEEYETIFKEQFRATKIYQNIIELLTYNSLGMSDIAKKIDVPKGGGLNSYLQNLVRAQFIREYRPTSFDTRQTNQGNKLQRRPRTRTQRFKLTDYFLIFYFRYIHQHKDLIYHNSQKANLFRSITASTFSNYLGFAFERLCEDAIMSILRVIDLELTDIESMGPYFQRRTGDLDVSSNPQNNTEGVQIDYMIWRRDKVCTIMEFKYHNKLMGMDVVHSMEQKIKKLNLPTNISIEKVLVSANGVSASVKNSKYFNHVLTIDDLV